MLTGHVPAGYLLTRCLIAKPAGPWLWLGLAASVLPDIDLLWFYFVDNGRFTHHHYWTHRPFIWAVALAGWAAVSSIARLPRARLAGVIVALNVLLHIALDGLWGKIDWLYPWSTRGYGGLIYVRPVYSFWILNFVFHWTFLIELAVILWAAATFIRDRRRLAAAPPPPPTDHQHDLRS